MFPGLKTATRYTVKCQNWEPSKINNLNDSPYLVMGFSFCFIILVLPVCQRPRSLLRHDRKYKGTGHYIGNYSKIIVSIKANLAILSNGELLMV